MESKKVFVRGSCPKIGKFSRLRICDMERGYIMLYPLEIFVISPLSIEHALSPDTTHPSNSFLGTSQRWTWKSRGGPFEPSEPLQFGSPTVGLMF